MHCPGMWQSSGSPKLLERTRYTRALPLHIRRSLASDRWSCSGMNVARQSKNSAGCTMSCMAGIVSTFLRTLAWPCEICIPLVLNRLASEPTLAITCHSPETPQSTGTWPLLLPESQWRLPWSCAARSLQPGLLLGRPCTPPSSRAARVQHAVFCLCSGLQAAKLLP